MIHYELLSVETQPVTSVKSCQYVLFNPGFLMVNYYIKICLGEGDVFIFPQTRPVFLPHVISPHQRLPSCLFASTCILPVNSLLNLSEMSSLSLNQRKQKRMSPSYCLGPCEPGSCPLAYLAEPILVNHIGGKVGCVLLNFPVTKRRMKMYLEMSPTPSVGPDRKKLRQFSGVTTSHDKGRVLLFFSFSTTIYHDSRPPGVRSARSRRRGPGHGGEVDGAVDIPGEPSVPARDHDRGLADRPSGGGALRE